MGRVREGATTEPDQRRENIFAEGLCPMWVSPPGVKLLRETLGLLLGPAAIGDHFGRIQ